MLVLSRKPGEQIVIDGGITITVVEVNGGRIKLGIDAPRSLRVLRGELAEFHGEDLVADRPGWRADVADEPVFVAKSR